MQSIGEELRQERELRQISLEEVAQTTRIPLRALVSLEEGRSEELPGEVFVRGFVKSYAKALGLDGAEMLERRAAREDEAPPDFARTLSSVHSDERGRRVGIGIAVVILVILFTLAVSIMLGPRRRHTPIQLSQGTTSPVEGAVCPAGSWPPSGAERAPTLAGLAAAALAPAALAPAALAPAVLAPEVLAPEVLAPEVLASEVLAPEVLASEDA